MNVPAGCAVGLSTIRSLSHLPESTMTGETIVECARGLVRAAEATGSKPPFRITVPAGTNLQETWDGENPTLEQRLKDIGEVKEVVVGKGRGVSIDSVGAEEEVANRGG